MREGPCYPQPSKTQVMSCCLITTVDVQSQLHPFEGDVNLTDLLSQSVHQRMFAARE
jgi:hypothetical protein